MYRTLDNIEFERRPDGTVVLRVYYARDDSGRVIDELVFELTDEDWAETAASVSRCGNTPENRRHFLELHNAPRGEG